ncbi:GTP 3',8-cyclase MoaA [Azospirillum sp. TSO22-1]|uniref:GTP 3',8-cyclase MoaA n=1 Tax=Azospirillum sp. TSO22-1 TaxID=716789 RepID=UPI0020005919|nr:GTP 3',8-cyclase MoaA [Azospirillum sp. TSO22-1]
MPVRPLPLTDSFGRTIRYLRLSVTDRCGFRCVYCMAEDAGFLPKAEVLTLEEIDRLASVFVKLGTRKLRLTGGEPLVRPGIMDLVRSLGRHLRSGALDELTLTTNGSMLFKHAAGLAEAGVKRVNVSLDTLDPHKFRAITRWGRLDKVLGGIDAAVDAGLRIKINAVALRGVNDDEVHRMVEWCGERGFDLTFIEVMPLGGAPCSEQYLPLSRVRSELEMRWTLEDTDHRTGGPARYVRVTETGGRIGFITPLTHSFCESCNRVRLTCTGMLCLCLGREDAADLRTPLRQGDDERLEEAVRDAVARKPAGHDFAPGRAGRHAAPQRRMSVTGG